MQIAKKGAEKLESRLNIELSKAEIWLSNNKQKIGKKSDLLD